MKTGILRWSKKAAKIIVITIGSVFLLLFLLPYILPGTISKEIKKLVNNSIEGKVEFSKARLSFFKHFPSLTLTLYNFKSTGSVPYQDETLLAAGEVAFGIRIPDLIRGNIHINEFFMKEASINILVDEEGDANYNVFKSSSVSADTSSSAPDTTTALQIEKIVIEKSILVYKDAYADIFISANGLNYSGKGDLSKAIFDLASHISINSFDININGEPYVINKKINADLVTKVNTNSLELEFAKNTVMVNRLPLEITGKYEFLSRGERMNFELSSEKADLGDVFTALPPSYQGWRKKTKIKGDARISASLSGLYIAGTDTIPDLAFSMKLRDGYIAYENLSEPVSNLYLDLETRMPALNLDSLSLNIDSVFFNLGKDHLSSVLKIKGYEAPYIFTRTSGEMDLEKVGKFLGLQQYELKGKLSLQLDADGYYAEEQNPDRLRSDFKVVSIPAFHLRSRLQNGYFHYTDMPVSVQQINFNIEANCPDNNYHHISAAIDNIDIKALDNYIKGFFHFRNADDSPIDAGLDAVVRLSDIQKIYPLDSVDINGNLAMSIRSSGDYQPAKKIFPKTEAVLKVEDAFLKTKYYPAPIEKIAVNAAVQNKDGTMKGWRMDVQPISFEFEGKPFIVKADMQNFDNLRYDIESKGELNLGKIFKLFSVEGWDVVGTIETDLSLKGSLADVDARRYDRLNNKGTVKVNRLVVYSTLYPLPFIIDRGIFRINQDQVKIDQFRTKYGKTVAVLSGSFSNIPNYIKGNGPLKGDVHLQSDHLLLDELMAYNSDTVSTRPDSLAAGSSGVILVPADLDMRFTTDIKTLDYNKLNIKSVKGEVLIKDAVLKMKETGFKLADAVTVMNGSYRTLSSTRASFTYNIKIDSFDVKKMYNEVELFRQLVPAASKAEGIVSLDYDLEGKLDGNMFPIMPSLKGGGDLAVQKVKLNGFKLFSAISKETGKEAMNDPELKKIHFKTTIKNNVVTLEKTKIKVKGYRLRIQGQTSFDGSIKFDCRLGLPPFGIVGIPIRATGTGQDPKIKVGKTDKLPLKEQKEEKEDTDPGSKK
jgi:AsmA protein